jgi:hypothetical protein
MADYRLSVQVIKRSSGRNAVAAAAYRHAMRLTDERYAESHDYTRKAGVLHSEIFAPANAPDWMRDRGQLWNAVEAAEKRKDAQLAREFVLSLPHELDHEAHRALVAEFCESELVARGMIADAAIHAPGQEGDERNHHAHIMATMRTLTAEGFGPKNRDWNETAVVEAWRSQWAAIQNREFERRGLEIRVDHRSLAAQGIDREPQKHLGPIASEIERSGRVSWRGLENRFIAERNALREAIRTAPDDEARRVAFEKLKFTNWEARKFATHEAERAASLARARDEARAGAARLEADLQRQHGPMRAVLDEKAASLESRLEARGIRKFVRDLFGRTTKDRKELEAVTRDKDQIDGVQKQARAEFQDKSAAKAADLSAKLDREAQSLQAGAQRARERREAQGWESRPEPIKAAPRPQDRERNGDSGKAPSPPLQTEFDRLKGAKPETAPTPARNPSPEPPRAQSDIANERAAEARRAVSSDVQSSAPQMKADAPAHQAGKRAEPDQTAGSKPEREKPGHLNWTLNIGTPPLARETAPKPSAPQQGPEAPPAPSPFSLGELLGSAGHVTRDVFGGAASNTPAPREPAPAPSPFSLGELLGAPGHITRDIFGADKAKPAMDIESQIKRNEEQARQAEAEAVKQAQNNQVWINRARDRDR